MAEVAELTAEERRGRRRRRNAIQDTEYSEEIVIADCEFLIFRANATGEPLARAFAMLTNRFRPHDLTRTINGCAIQVTERLDPVFSSWFRAVSQDGVA